ncbi:hypothetical protein KEM55_003549 [Ascosphaera atra]|nr:hypothetical protein KEM55_003549 [Ascosphaera atra]
MDRDDAPSVDSTVSKITQSILDDVFYNIIHDIVAKVHREEKMARMRSAVTIARQRGEAEESERRQNNGKPSEGLSSPAQGVRVETEGAVYEDGKVYLRGNPLATTKEVICPHCRLPRLLYPPYGLGARPPPEPHREYCRKVPPIVADGLDAQGIPFVTDKIQRKRKNPPPATNSAIPGAPTANSNMNPSDSQNTTERPHIEAPTFPSVKCPNCPRYIVTTRIAQHLERCMGIGGTRRGTANRTRTPQVADNASVTSNDSAGGTGKAASGATNGTAKPSPLKRSMQADDSDGAVQPNPKKKKTWTKKAKDATGTAGTGSTKPGVPSKLKKTESHSGTDLPGGAQSNGELGAGEKKKLKIKLKAS